MSHHLKAEIEERDERMRTDVFVARAECKWYSGEETLPHMLDKIPQERIDKILESTDGYPAMNRQLVKNIDKVKIEPREMALDKAKITKVAIPDGEARDVFEGELFFVIKIPSLFRIDSEELLENMNVLFSINCKYSSTRLTVVKYLGTNRP